MIQFNRKKYIFAFLLALTLSVSSCTSLRYIRDVESYERQKHLHGNRAGRAALESGLTVGSVILGALTGTGIAYVPQGNRLKKVALVNESPDTLVINMLTDISWKKDSFCDFLQIEIPPSKRCKLLVPNGAVYNVYFSNTPEIKTDDEMIELNTLTTRKLRLRAGMTEVMTNDSIFTTIN